jgi:2,4-dienoyl-CoA reductase-like NADH-dependent reductase (Old Yellow Enzyme family)
LLERKNMSHLFSPIRIRELTIPNRIVVAPMCQYIAENGCMHDWHLMHLGQFAVSGAGLVITEMTSVEPEGRIGPYCVGLYSDECEIAMRHVVAFCRKFGGAKLGIQLAHAGRKSSVLPPWQGRQSVPVSEGGWHPVGPSPIPVLAQQPPPRELSRDNIDGLIGKFVAATNRAERLGFDLIELHGAHGYLIHQFLSPISNQRVDEYGGSLENRMRFPLELFRAMRMAWPSQKPMGMKVSARDWCRGGWSMDDTLEFCRRLRDLGCDFVVVSSGGIVWNEEIPTAPGFQVEFAEQIRRDVGISVTAIGLLTEARQAENIVSSGAADMVALARGMLWDPRWSWHAANALGGNCFMLNQYTRARPQLAHDTFAVGDAGRARSTISAAASA